MGNRERARILGRLRELCLGLPEVEERPSHGAPTFFVRGKRAFVTIVTDHHGDGRFALWCAAPDGVQVASRVSRPRAFLRTALLRPPRLAWRPSRPRPRVGRARRHRRGRLCRGRPGAAPRRGSETAVIVEGEVGPLGGGDGLLRVPCRKQHTGAPWLRRGRFSGRAASRGLRSASLNNRKPNVSAEDKSRTRCLA